jgi:hypothetical protein
VEFSSCVLSHSLRHKQAAEAEAAASAARKEREMQALAEAEAAEARLLLEAGGDSSFSCAFSLASPTSLASHFYVLLCCQIQTVCTRC